MDTKSVTDRIPYFVGDDHFRPHTLFCHLHLDVMHQSHFQSRVSALHLRFGYDKIALIGSEASTRLSQLCVVEGVDIK